MIVSYCLSPNCPDPENPPQMDFCQACGNNLVLKDRYRGVKKIGKGGFGATFLAQDLGLPGNPFCVIKQLRPSTDDQDAFQMALDLFEREAKTLGKIDHPQIPRLLDYFEEDKQFYLVQSLVKGRNLQQEVKKNGVFSEMTAKRFLAEMLPVMKYIHSIKIIHRDIKPANIIRREQDGQLVLIDFGAVKDQVNTQLAKNYGQTALTQFSIGTVGFAPPEQLAMRPVYSSDLYALGATCLYLMTGKSPKDFACDEFTGELLWEKEVQVSPSFAKVLRKMLEVDVRSRFRAAEDVMNALDIAPYEQELEQSMIGNKSSSGSNSAGEKKAISSPQDLEMGETTGYTSATTKLAMAIRARKSRQGKTQFVVDLTKETVLVAYSNGRTNFSNQVFDRLNLANSNLSGSNFRHCQMIAVNFEETNLSRANFYDCNMNKAILHKAILEEAYLVRADLTNADLRGADLTRADLTSCNLKGANLCGANLAEAKIDDRQLEEAKTNWSTIFPDGKRKLW